MSEVVVKDRSVFLEGLGLKKGGFEILPCGEGLVGRFNNKLDSI